MENIRNTRRIKKTLQEPAIWVMISLLSLIISDFIPNWAYVIIIIFMGFNMKYDNS